MVQQDIAVLTLIVGLLTGTLITLCFIIVIYVTRLFEDKNQGGYETPKGDDDETPGGDDDGNNSRNTPTPVFLSVVRSKFAKHPL